MTEARVAQNLITASIIANEELKVKKDEAHSLASIINQKKKKKLQIFLSQNLKKLICKKF